MRPAILCFAFIAAGLIEVQSWPDATVSPESSISDLATHALHGHPGRASAVLPAIPGVLPVRSASLPAPERELTAPPHAHARVRTGS